ncbi:MAG TPA: hypothetical protein DCS21_08090, partial [Gammaproteobacteria bacterium]|nr:hypothetical protein [Gammaproteobacteria bacterium]
MEKDPSPLSDPTQLRRHAEARLQGKLTRLGDSPPTVEESLKLIHELQVHQVELELQNHALQVARCQLEESLERQVDLYDFAPVGYATLASDGTILEINLAGATLLGLERPRLINRRFGLMVSVETRPVFNQFVEQALAGVTAASCEVVLALSPAPPHWVQLEGLGSVSDEQRQCRIALL